MTDFIMTPTNIDYLESIFRDPITGKWSIPILTFNLLHRNPFYYDVDPLNNDPKYRKSVVNHLYTRLTEKWLYKEPVFKKLLKYFKIDKTGETGKVSLIEDPDKPVDIKINEEYKNFIFKYIEKVFITKHFINKILKEYVKTTRIKWYDLYNNTSTLKDLFAHKLKKLIVSTIYEMIGKTVKKK